MFSFKDNDEKQGFISWVSGINKKIRGYVGAQELSLLFNKTLMYQSTYEKLLKLRRKDPSVLDCYKLNSYIFEESMGITNSLKVVYMLEIPLCEIPLYINTSHMLLSRIAEWRLKVGR